MFSFQKAFDFIFLFFFFLGLVYLLAPSPAFPLPLPDSVQSLEEADTEAPLKRAYFTNYDREEVIKHYQSAFSQIKILGFSPPLLRLNYPPEEAYSLIRDQTRSTFLEEIVYPLRDSFFVNGFKPRFAKDEIWYKGVHYEQKITVRYATSSVLFRIVIGVATLVLLVIVLKQSKQALYEFFR